MAGSGVMTEHVALLHDGRVLVDETGALPSFVPAEDDNALTTALRLVGADLLLAPVAKLADEQRVHVVGTRDAPPTGRYVDPAALPADLAEVVARAVDEQDPTRTPPARPAWFTRAWFDRVEAWIDSVLAGSGRRRTHPIEAVKLLEHLRGREGHHRHRRHLAEGAL